MKSRSATAGEPAATELALATWKGRVFMRAPIPAEERETRVSRVVAEALVRRQGPRRIVTRATRLGFSPTLTRAVVVACGASALDVDSLPSRRQAED
jgi:hypothetical protein